MNAPEAGGGRLVSLDAYRGFVMLAMASAGFALGEFSGHWPDSQLWHFVGYHVDHVSWRGCSFWDLIQPSFMFIVGVAMPFSYAARAARGDTAVRQFAHGLIRAAVLVALGVFLASAWSKGTNFVFTNVLAQIGLGYPFVLLLLGRSPRVQFLTALAILVGYWALFAAYPLPPDDFPFARYGVVPGKTGMTGFFEHWERNVNVASAFDRWFLNLFPRPDGRPFVFNDGGYATLNFVPSAATMIFGVVAGEWLRGPATPGHKVRGLLAAAAAGLLVGTVLDQTVCPAVKRIWTPSWTVYSAGWTCGLLALFYGLIDAAGWRRWAYPLVVVGLNSIAFYLMAQLMKPWVRTQLAIHLGPGLFRGEAGKVVEAAAVLFVFWLIAAWMHRQRIYVRV